MTERTLSLSLDTKVEEIAVANQEWLRFPTSREFHPLISQFVINESPLKGSVEYMGAYYIERHYGFADRYSSYRTREKVKGLEKDLAEAEGKAGLSSELRALKRTIADLKKKAKEQKTEELDIIIDIGKDAGEGDLELALRNLEQIKKLSEV